MGMLICCVFGTNLHSNPFKNRGNSNHIFTHNNVCSCIYFLDKFSLRDILTLLQGFELESSPESSIGSYWRVTRLSAGHSSHPK